MIQAYSRDIDGRALARGVTIDRIEYGLAWRVKQLEWFDKEQAKGVGPDHHFLFDTIDEKGQRQVGVSIIVTWPTGADKVKSEAKNGERFSANFPMTPGQNSFSAVVVDGLPSERVKGVGMGQDTPSGYNPGIHTSTFVVFQRSYVGETKPKPPEKPPTFGPLARPCDGITTQKWGQNAADYARFGIPGHNGWDIGNQEGTRIVSVADGVVAFVDYDVDYGNYIRINHPHLGLDSFYAHLSASNVRVGDRVAKGQFIAIMGATGNATGPHLHFELRLTGDNSYVLLSDGYGKGRFDPAIAYWLFNREKI